MAKAVEKIEEGATVADILERAADLIEPEGRWVKFSFGTMDRSGPCCAVGAVTRALGLSSIFAAEAWLDGHAVPFLGMNAERLEKWNDRACRTQVDVVSKLREAAAKARKQGL
jgi:hypothetical protein